MKYRVHGVKGVRYGITDGVAKEGRGEGTIVDKSD